MEIKKLQIASFGKLHNEEITFDEGFNYFYGPNEAGKTTVRMFITYILFGLKKDERDPYISHRDGQLGGRLYLKIDEKDWMIERYLHRNNGKPLIYENEVEVDEERLQNALKGLDRFLFEAIFSFQDRDLQAIREQTPESIGKVLFNLGMTGSDQIANVEKMIRKEKDDIFKLRGTTQPIYLKLKELDDLTKKMKELEEQEKTYTSLQQRQSVEEERLTQLSNYEEKLQTKSKYYEKLLSVKAAIIDYQLYDKQLISLDHVKHFSNEIIDKFHHLRDGLFELKKDYDVRKGRLNQLEDEVKTVRISTDYSLEDLNELMREMHSGSRLQTELDEMSRRINNEQHLLNELLEEASFSFSKSDIQQLNVSSYTESYWKKLNDDYERFDEDLQNIKSKMLIKDEEIEHIHKEIESVKNDMLSETEYEKLKEKESKWHHRHQLNAWQGNVIEEWQERLKRVNKEKQMIKIWKPATMIIAVLILSSLLLFFSNSTIAYLLIPIFLVASMAIFFTLSKRNKNYEKESKRIKEMITKMSADESVDFSDKEQKLINEYEKKKDKLNELTLKLDYEKSALRDLNGEKSTVVERHQQLQLQIDKVLEEYPFLVSFELFQWANVHQMLMKAKQIVKNITDLEDQYVAIKEKLEEKEKVAHTFISLFKNEKINEDESIWKQCIRCIEQEKQLKELIQEKEKWINDLQEELDQIERSMYPYESELKQLMTNIHVDHEEQFLKRIEQYDQYVSYLDKKEQSEKIVYAMFPEQMADVLKQSYDWNEIEVKINEINNELIRCQNDYNDVRNSLSNIVAEMRQLEKDGTLSELVHKKATLIEEIKQLAKTYSIYATAEGFLEDTKERYQNVYFPEIVQQATLFFEKITDGAYKQIRFSKSDETIKVENISGDWFTVKQLSEGTADQLYVSLRLAISSVLNDFLYVPFILDDAFNHFDRHRKQKMLSLLKEISKRQQIIYLTCTEINKEDIA